MITLRAAQDRGFADHGWLQTFHSFSFADYYDPAYMSFGPLRVINEDVIAPSMGFGTHGHHDMEIITYVLEGELSHKDSMGNGSTILPGNVQRMSAGSGVRHSEFNMGKVPTHLLQIWIEPNELGIEPGYQEKNFSQTDKRGKLCLIANPTGTAGAVKIHQDAQIYAGLFDAEESAHYSVNTERQIYLHVARGAIQVNNTRLQAGDALKMQNILQVEIGSGKHAEVLLFDLPFN